MLRLLINLDRSPDRLSWMQEEFLRLGLDFHRVPAIDGNELAETDLAKVTLQRANGMRWPHNEVACFLSHRECWKLATTTNETHISIFEDDVHLSSSSARFLSDASWILDGMDIVKLETNLQPTRLARKAAVRERDYSLSEIRAQSRGSGGYIITKSAAARLLGMSYRFDRTVDDFLFDRSGCQNVFGCYQLKPAICIQDSVLKGKNAVLSSIIDEDRTKHITHPQKLSGEQKLKRELVRPFEQFAGFLFRTGRLVVRGERTIKVPYDTRN